MAEWYSVVHLDRMVEVTGVYSSPNTTWTLPFTDDTLDTIVLGPDFVADFGDILEPDSNSGGSVVLAGDYSDGPVVIGRGYTMSVELTRPYFRDAQGRARVDAFLNIQRIIAAYHKTGALDIRATHPDISIVSDRTESLDIDPIKERGVLTMWLGSRADDVKVFLENRTPKPSTVASVEMICDYASRVLE